MPNALLLSGYDAQSHIYWREGVVKHLSQFDWRVFTLPPRYFSWRIRGNGLWWGVENKDEIDKKYDLLLVTSMVDLATLRSLCPSLVQVPTAVYFHENQFAYPDTNNNQGQLEAQITSIYTALSADQLFFNSHYNLDTFLSGVEQLLKKMPDFVPGSLAQKLKAKCIVLPVPLNEITGVTKALPAIGKSKFSIVWNHRWEWDKDPELLFKVITSLSSSLPLTFHIVGQSFRSMPGIFEDIKALLDRRGWLGRWGFIEDRKEYIELLQVANMVLSTAAHDFQGLSVLEAVQYGCEPLLPKRVVYPEYFGQEYLYDPVDYSSASVKISEAVDNFTQGDANVVKTSLREVIPRFTWPELEQAYRLGFEGLICSD